MSTELPPDPETPSEHEPEPADGYAEMNIVPSSAVEASILEAAALMELDGRAPSHDELQVARDLVALLRALAPRLDEGAAAQAFADVALLAGRLLDAQGEAIEAAREAFRRAPGSRGVAHALRRAAVRAGSSQDLLTALDAEGRGATADVRAAFELARGRVLIDVLGDAEAASVILEQATAHSGSAGRALAALERIAVKAGKFVEAAAFARRRADVVGSPRLGAEHLARAARHLERAGEPAKEPCVAARLKDPHAPSVAFLVERGAADASAEVALRDDQIAARLVAEGPARLEAAFVLRYRVRDVARAQAAFRAAADANLGPARAVALEELALLHERRGDWEAAEATHREVAAAWGDSPPAKADALVRVAIACASGGRREDAIAALEQALEIAPGLPDALDRLGRLLYEAGETGKVERLHQLEADSATSDRERAVAWRRLGEIMIDDPARLDQAIDLLRRALDLTPADAGLRSILERALVRKGDHAALVAFYEQELALDPAPTTARQAWLLERVAQLALERLGDRRKAVDALRRVVTLSEIGVLDPRLRLAELLEEEGQHAEAGALFHALALRTEEPAARASLLERAAQADERRGDPEAAVDRLRQAMAVAPASHGVWGAAGRAMLRAHKYEDVVALLEHAAQSATTVEDKARWCLKQAHVLDECLGRRDEAILRLEPAAAGGDLRAQGALVRLYLLTDRLTDVSRASSLALGPTAALRAAMLAEHAGELEQALAALAGAKAVVPDVASLIAARLLVKAHKWEEAATLYESGEVPLDPRHERWRAAELRADRLGDPARAAALFEERPDDELDDPGVLLFLAEHADGEARAAALGRIVDHFADPRECAIAADDLAHLEERRGHAGAAIQARQTLVELEPSDLDNQLRLEVALDRAHDRQGLARLLRQTARTREEDPALAHAYGVLVGSVLSEVGQHQEALDALDAVALDGAAMGLAGRVLAVRAHVALGDEKGRRAALYGLGRALPPGPERAWVFLALGRSLAQGAPDQRAALAALEEALAADPSSPAALAELSALADTAGEGERVIDALRRAIDATEDDALRGELGVELGVRLVNAKRIDEADPVVKRLVASATPSVGARLLACELEERHGRWEELVAALAALAAHPECPPALRERALLRTARVQRDKLNDRVSAKKVVAELLGILGDDLAGLEIKLEANALASDARGEAEVLAKIVAHPDVSAAKRDPYRLRLAGLLEEKLDDPAGAISVLADVQGHEVGARLLELGEKSGRWDLAASALEALLDRGGVPPDFERAARLRLATLLDGPLGKPEAATAHYERAVALAPDDLDVLERLAARPNLAPARVIELQQKLLGARPKRLESVRALHAAWLAAGDEDGAFLAEAVLVGLGVADEDEQYFYRQRRGRLMNEVPTPLKGEDLKLLCPETDGAAAAVLRALAEPIGHVFSVDLDGYGLADGGATPAPGMAASLERVSKQLGVPSYRASIVGSRLGPAVEPGAPAWILIPRAFDEAGRREQLAVAGLLLGRLAFGGALADPRRLTPSSPAQLAYVLEAVCALFVDGWTGPSAGKPVFEDIKRRLDKAPGGSPSTSLAARRLADAGPIDVPELIRGFERGAARAAVFVAQDPAAAIALVGAGRSVDDLPDVVWAQVAFALSPQHLELRAKHHLGVKP